MLYVVPVQLMTHAPECAIRFFISSFSLLAFYSAVCLLFAIAA
jgi:hypothetical protein